MARVLYVGADVREHPARNNDDWTSDRREKYLLRPDVARPLSVDPNVWSQARAPGAEGRETPLLPWISVEAVLQRARSWEAPGDRIVIALGVVAEDSQEEADIADGMGAKAELEVRPSWDFLGFDVADGTISGLCNCGYDDEDDVADLRRSWGPRLNEHGLFSDRADALAFRRLVDERVPEHAPFRVYGIWVAAP